MKNVLSLLMVVLFVGCAKWGGNAPSNPQDLLTPFHSWICTFETGSSTPDYVVLPLQNMTYNVRDIFVESLCDASTVPETCNFLPIDATVSRTTFTVHSQGISGLRYELSGTQMRVYMSEVDPSIGNLICNR